ncbi:MAG: histidinol-phosphate transaminase [Crocinitomicaceae bacterium]|nr:histidinol-phosphate transaminase [Crocinitomicaceae bacterium]
MKNINDLIRPHLKGLKPYSSARDEYVGEASAWLDANESPLDNGINRYPDPYQTRIKEFLAKKSNINVDQILVGNGSDEVIDLLFRAFCEPGADNIIINPPTYGMYKVSADINGISYKEVPLNEDFSLNPSKILSNIDGNTKMIFICSPNNPTGNIMNYDDISTIASGFNGLVIVDEAYIDFTQKNSWINSLDKFSNIVVIQTLSKSYSAAGLRVGFLYANPEVIAILNKIKPPYNVNALSQKAALEVLQNEDVNKKVLDDIQSEKIRVKTALENMDLIKKIYPSDANFWLVQVDDANEVYEKLINKGVVVRNRSTQLNCENTLRLTVGNKTENDLLITELKKI